MSSMTPALYFIAYNANAQKVKKADPIPEQKWDEHKAQIVRLFRAGKTRDQILAHLKTKGFRPSPRQLYSRMHDDWSLRRYSGPRSVSSGVPAMEGVILTDTVDDVCFKEPLILIWEHHINQERLLYKKIDSYSADDGLPSYLIYLPIHFPTDAIRQVIVSDERPALGKLATYEQHAFFGRPLSAGELIDMMTTYQRKLLSQSDGIDPNYLALGLVLAEILAMLIHVNGGDSTWNASWQSAAVEREAQCRGAAAILDMIRKEVRDTELVRRMTEMHQTQRQIFDFICQPFQIPCQYIASPPGAEATIALEECQAQKQGFNSFDILSGSPRQYKTVQPREEITLMKEGETCRGTNEALECVKHTVMMLLPYSQCTTTRPGVDGYEPPCCGIWY